MCFSYKKKFQSMYIFFNFLICGILKKYFSVARFHITFEKFSSNSKILISGFQNCKKILKKNSYELGKINEFYKQFFIFLLSLVCKIKKKLLYHSESFTILTEFLYWFEIYFQQYCKFLLFTKKYFL